jgi:hypothetical protein
MFTFTPLDEGDRVIANIPLTLTELHDLRTVLQSALDYNPSTNDFAEAMEPARKLLGPVAFSRWLLALKTIRTNGERESYMNFMFEDWISTWRIVDFIDRVWTVAEVSRAWTDPAEVELEASAEEEAYFAE